jgi:hypothetical protein
MTMIRSLAGPFAGHPLRIGAATVALLGGAALFWYLVSPLWIRTTATEELSGATATLARGELTFVDDVHNGKGPVLIVESDGKRYVRFENVSITNGPDLHVYLSRDSGGRYVEANSVYLGPLKATNGSFHYELGPSVAVAEYRSVIVWCRNFSTLFTWADLAR